MEHQEDKISFWIIALPFDTVKTLVQVDYTGRYSGFLECAKSIVRNEGVGRLFRGWQAAFSRGIPGAAVTFWAYNSCNVYLERQKD